MAGLILFSWPNPGIKQVFGAKQFSDNSKSFYNLPRSGISRDGWTPSGLLAQGTIYKQISLWLSTKIYLFKCSVGQQSYEHTSDDDKIWDV